MLPKSAIWLCILATLFTILAVQSQDTTTTTSSPASSTTKKPPTPEEECALVNSSCETCVSHPKCLFCYNPKNAQGQKCVPYPTGDIIPRSDVCDLGDARWGVCWVNFKIMLIVMGVLGGVILLTLLCCIWCCCCRSGKAAKRKYLKEEEQVERQREERKIKSEERRAERKLKNDEIRKKYGLGVQFKGKLLDEEVQGLIKDDAPYQRFDQA